MNEQNIICPGKRLHGLGIDRSVIQKILDKATRVTAINGTQELVMHSNLAVLDTARNRSMTATSI